MLNEKQSNISHSDFLSNKETGELIETQGLSPKSFKLIRLGIVIILYVGLIGLIYFSYSQSVQYTADCEYVYSSESKLGLVKSEYSNLLQKKIEMSSIKKDLEKTTNGFREICSRLHLEVLHNSSALINKKQKIDIFKAQIKHREELMLKFYTKEKYENEITAIKANISMITHQIEELK